MTSEPDPYYAPNSVTYRATELVRPHGFYSGLPPVDAKRNVAQMLGSAVFDRRWLEKVHLPVLRHLLIPRIPHVLTLATERGAIYATHLDAAPLHLDSAHTGLLTGAAKHLNGHHVTVSHAAAAALYTHCNGGALSGVPIDLQVPALAAGLSLDEVIFRHRDGTLTVEHAQVMFALTEPLPGT